MFNLHPPLSSFPFVILTLVVIFEAINHVYRWKLSKDIANTLLIALCIFAPLTYLSGYYNIDKASASFEVSEDLIAAHQAVAKFFLISLVPCVLLAFLEKAATRGKHFYLIAYYFFLLISYGLVIFTSFRGGELVFCYGAGVNLTYEGKDQKLIAKEVELLFK